jgi:hypothetical protein
MFTAKFRNGARNQPNTPMVLTIDALLMKFGTRCINTQTPKSILQMNASRDKNKSPFIKNFIQNTINLLHLTKN